MAYESLGLELHSHVVMSSLPNGGFVGDAVCGNGDKLLVGLKNLGDGLTLADLGSQYGQF